MLTISFVTVSDTAGGAEAHTVALARGLGERGNSVALYGRCPGWDERALPRHDLDLGPKWSRRTMAAGLLKAPLERLQAREVPASSVFHLQFKREQIVLTDPLARKGAVVWTEHGRWLGGAAGRLLAPPYARAARQASRVVCVSAQVAADLSTLVERRKLVVIPNAVDTERYTPPPAGLRAELRDRLLPERFHDRTVAVLASRLHPAKRHDRAIAAARASGSALLIVGDGPDRERLRHVAGDSPDVHFAGHQEDVRDFLAAADFYLYCGAGTDGTPTAVLEAAACGLPVVAFEGDPGAELVPRLGGVVLAAPALLTRDLVAALTAARGCGVEYVREHHGRRRWLDAYENVLRECAR